MSEDQSRLWLAEIAALDAEAEANERDVEPITRFTQALNNLEEAAAQYKESGVVRNDAIAQAFPAIDSNYQSAARFLERHDIDPTPLLVWVQTKPIAGIADLRVLIQRAGIIVQCRGEQLRKSISVLRAQTQANAESERAEGAGAGRDPAEGEQAEGTDRRRRKGRGRPADTDPEADKRIYDAWQTRQYTTYAALAQELHTTKRAVKLAIERHGKRLKRPKQNRCES